MEATLDLYNCVRSNFPEITAKADREHIRLWSELDPEFAYSWFGSLANALNSEMCKGTNHGSHSELFIFISNSLENCTKEIHKCIDVSFTENLFWQVPSEKAAPYWHALPEPLKELYLGFHRRAPL
ncbi:hypothetical protein ACNFCK_20740 [Pseudomonas sp. NY15366]